MNSENQILKEKIKELEEQNSFYQKIFDYLPFGLQVFDEKGNQKLVNSKQKKILQDKNLENKLNEFTDHFKQAFAGKQFDFIFDNSSFEKNTGIFNKKIIPIKNNKNSKTDYIITILDDITENKQIEDYYNENQERFRAFFEQDQQIKLVIDPENGNIEEANHAAEQFYGYSKKELKKINIHTINILSKKEIEHEMHNAILLNKNYFNFKHKIANGEIKDVMVYSSPIKIRNKKFLFSIIHDITEQKATEKKLNQIEKQYEKYVKHSPDILYTYSNKRGAIYWTTKVKEILGYSSEELKKDPFLWNRSIHPDDKPKVAEAINNYENEKKYCITYRIKTKDNNWKWLQDTFMNIETVQDEIIINGRALDITESKTLELKLEQIKQRFNLAMQATSDGIWDWNLVTNEIYFSPNWKKMLGYKDHELPNDFSIWEKLTHPDDVKNSWYILNQHIKGERERFEVEFKMQHKNGHWVNILSRANAIFDNNNTAYRVVGTHVDITNRKTLEKQLVAEKEKAQQYLDEIAATNEELQQSNQEYLAINEEIRQTNETLHETNLKLEESENRFKLIVDNTPLAVYQLRDIDQKAEYINSTFIKWFGYTVEDVPTVDYWWPLAYPDENYRKKVSKEWYNKIEEANRLNTNMKPMITEVTCKDRSKKTIQWGFISANNKSWAFGLDLTKQQKSEKALKESETKFKTVFDILEVGLTITNEKGNIIDCNKASERILGITKKEHLSRNYAGKEWNIIRTDKTHMPSEEFASVRAMKEKQPITNVEMGIVKPDGIIWISVSASPLKIKGYGVLVAYIDITDRINAEEERIIFNRNFEAFLNQTSDFVYFKDIESRFVFCSQTLAKITEHENWKQMIGKHDFEVFPPDTAKIYYQEELPVFQEGKPLLNKVDPYYDSDGKLKYVSTSKWPLFDDKNKVAGIFGISRDITEQKIMEQELIKAKNEAETANRFKSEFLANMSHEIRTPMNAILGYTEILSKKLANESELSSFLNGIRDSGKNLISLINDILDLSKIEAGRMEITSEPVNPFTIFEDIKQIFKVKAQYKQIDLLFNIDKSLPELLMLDQKRVRQVLFNLVGNAIKFTNQGEIKISIKIEGDVKPESEIDLFFEVSDTGIGIPKKQLNSIFEAFQSHGLTSKYEGTGLGLSITKRLVEAMDGTITVESEINVGSVFQVHLKKVKVPAISKSVLLPDIDFVENIIFNKPTVLLVDDMESNIDVIQYHLTDVNCDVITASSGEQALEIIKEITPDLILMDIQMPILNGYETTKLIKKIPKFKRVPILALTALAMKEQEKKYKHAFEEYLKKPIETSKLIRILMKYLSYQIKSNQNSIIESKSIELNPEDLNNEIKKYILTEIKPLYNALNEYLDTEDAFLFIYKLENYVKQQNFSKLDEFINNFKQATQNAQLKIIKKLLKEFGIFINQLNS